MNWLTLSAVCNFIIALLHIVIVVFLGPEGYRTFGAGEEFAQMAEQGKLFPHIITLGITIIFTIFGLYALSGTQFIPKLPFLKWILFLICGVYLIRGIGGIPMYLYANYSAPLMLWSSLASFLIGVFHFLGIRQYYIFLENS